MQLELCAAAQSGTDPDDVEIMNYLDEAASRRATAWTKPIFVGTSDGTDAGLDLPDGYELLHYVTDAQPRVTATTLANIAPALLPPHVI